MERRRFLELMGLIGAATATSCHGAPKERLQAYLTPLRELTPGVAAYFATVCRACPAGCGVVVKTREARPIKLEGNPAHPINQGALCARGQAFIQGLYSPHRVARPLIRREGRLVDASWEEALGEVATRLRGARSLGVFTGLESGAFEELLADALATWPGATLVHHEPAALTALAHASGVVFDRSEVPFVDLRGTDFVASLGADFLDGFLSPVKLSREWAAEHGFGASGRRMALEYWGPRRNLTATGADRFRAVPADALSAAAVELLGAVFRRRRDGLPAERAARYQAAIAALGAPRSGIDVEPLAELLVTAHAPLVLYGGSEVATAQASSVHAAVLLTNALLGAVGRALRYGAETALSKASPTRAAIALAASAADLDVLLVQGSNPAHSLPQEAAARLGASKFLVALAAEHDETTAQAHVVLPVHHPLESWGDFDVARGISGMMQPVRAPLHASRHAGDVLIDLVRRAGRSTRHSDFKPYVVERWARRTSRELDDVLVVGGSFAEDVPATAVELSAGLPRGLEVVPSPTTSAAADAALVVAMSSLLHDGREATRSWLLETPDSLTQTAWEVPVEVSADLAESHGIRPGDRLSLEARGVELRGPALIDPELAPGTVAVRCGGGRLHTADGMASGNVMALVAPVLDAPSGALALAATRVAVTRLGPGELTSVSGGTESAERFLALGVELPDARVGRFPILTRHGEELPPPGEEPHGKPLPMPADEVFSGGQPVPENIVPLTTHPEHRWGMVVDLDLCTGCGACVVACYAENNVATVGQQQVRLGREQSWIRIEKHVAPAPRGGQRIRWLPVMCQHCTQAPCETVCPVFAAYHTPDGLNAQIYNRCIGTRYCANNCPYKVRRFNYFDWPRPEPENQQLNPDVTVRSRGVMEKCTFCIQRIREATNRAKAEGRTVRDQEIRPACVQTCPTGALSFGDFRESSARVTQLAQDPRAYRLLDWSLNTRPGVVYLRRVHSTPEEV